jgi:phosphatidylinositol alpha-mannosyltransferase
VTLTVIGADEGELEPLILDPAGIEILGRVDDAEKERRLREADLLVAPSLGSESFGMVLTEAFAAGTPVVASDIAGYRDVVRDGLDGVLVPRGDATALAEAICDLVLDPPRRAAMAASAAERARRYAWPRVAGEVMDVYHEAIEAHAQGAPVKRPAERRLEPLDVDERSSRERWVARGRRAGMAGAMLGGAGLGFLALERIGLPQIAANLLTSRPDWLLIGLGLMCAAMVMRGFSWHAILRAALPHTRVRRRDAMQGTFIGVLMSATLPGRLGELSRSVIVARRVGRPRESLPVVIGTIVSQTLLNLLALAILGVIMFSSVNIGNHGALLLAAIAPVAALLVVLIVPLLLRGGVARSRRAAQLRSLLTRVRAGLRVFRSPRLGAIATGSQLAAWALQCASCYALLVSLGIDSHAGLAAAAGVLFAVNVSAVLPVTPSNLGVFQFACVTVLATFGVGRADALAYGIILQAVEIATAVLMGMPALVREGLSWKDVKLRAMQSAPVELRDRRAVHPGALVRG